MGSRTVQSGGNLGRYPTVFIIKKVRALVKIPQSALGHPDSVEDFSLLNMVIFAVWGK